MMLRHYAPLLLILVLAGAAMCIEVAAPFVRAHDYASTAFATIARNHVEFGLQATRGASILFVDRDDPAHSAVYAHHPFGYPLALAAVFSVFGASDAAARFPAILCSLGAIVLLYSLIESQFDRRTAIFTAAAYAFSPVNLFYGRLVSLEQPVVFLIVATVWAWYRWLERPDRLRFALVMLFLALGMLTEWQAYYLCALLPAHYWLVSRHTGPQRERGENEVARRTTGASRIGATPPRSRYGLVRLLLRWELVAIVALGPAMFGLFLAHLAWADPRQIAELRRVFWHRLGGTQSVETIAQLGGDASYSLFGFLAQLASHASHLLLPPLLIAALVGAARIFVRWRRRETSLLAASLSALLLAPAVCHTIIFHRTLYIHDCLIILYAPGVAALGGIGLRWLCERPRLTDPRLLAAVALIGWYFTGSIRVTMNLHAEGYVHATFLGHELARLTKPEDEIVVVGTSYHPAVEWYARRDVHFLDTAGPLSEIISRTHPNRLVVFPRREGVDDLAAAAPDRASQLVAKRTSEAKQFALEHGRELFRHETLLLTELPEPAEDRNEN